MKSLCLISAMLFLTASGCSIVAIVAGSSHPALVFSAAANVVSAGFMLSAWSNTL